MSLPQVQELIDSVPRKTRTTRKIKEQPESVPTLRSERVVQARKVETVNIIFMSFITLCLFIFGVLLFLTFVVPIHERMVDLSQNPSKITEIKESTTRY